ncbi:MAG TPA: hypothetical protein PKX07_14050 [Aggregatilineales bacterium]|jgi:hypothetical protein|nr:hypothetical protein [Aggregatilineales bacterium]
MDSTDSQKLEAIVAELMAVYDVKLPPVPVEIMLARPREGMWDEMDINQLTGGFLRLTDPFSPRMSMARMLARHLVFSPWGTARGLPDLVGRDEAHLRLLARMLIMPRALLTALPPAKRTPALISTDFEVPAEDALQRLDELGLS